MNAFDAVKAARRERAAQPSDDPRDAPPEERSALACNAHGCPCSGSIDIGSGGRFSCPWHAGLSPDLWGDVTLRLRQEGPLLALIGELQALHAAGGKGAPWVHRAMRAFAAESDLQPTPNERARWNHYLWRLREEIGFRVGVRQDRPAARVPQLDEPGFARPARAHVAGVEP